MLDPTGLYEFESYIDPRTIRARTLVVTLTGFVDAGHAQRLFDEHVTSTLPNHKVATFDIDQLVDYRGQRPSMVFDTDRFLEFHAPSMTLHQVVDESGVPFLLLAGQEPDLQWERLAKAIEQLVDTFDVQTTVMLGAIPMAVPHTRPVTLTRHASDPSLIPGNQPLFGRVQLAGSFPSMLEVRLAEAERQVIGITAHVPHYLAQSDFPDATLALLRALSEATGHTIPTSALAVSAGAARAQIGAELEQSEEAQALVSALEEQYDAFHEARPRPSIEPTHEDLPTADDIGREAENFLRQLADEQGKDDSPPTAV
ncbi:PAC2 family protein [Aestuariimicrobium ganziense]|uniref:PAC2 family protein n=1 Tax=Aestuariimicrobium ganziense TaxID=2773677 RepID=UPI001944B219|nr:PAC2 family protein [Aestuariimicrobium ganziense]